MRIETLRTDNFRHIGAVDLDLRAPVSVICEPNEAGKSTLLDALRDLLFEFPATKAGIGGWRDDEEEPILATACLHSGNERLRVTMKNEVGNNRLEGHVEKREIWERCTAPEVRKWLTACRGNMTYQTYGRLFGFSLFELLGGGDHLENTPLAAIIAGGAAGTAGSHIDAAIERLKRRRDELYRPGGRAKGQLNTGATSVLEARVNAVRAEANSGAIAAKEREINLCNERLADLGVQRAALIANRALLAALNGFRPSHAAWRSQITRLFATYLLSPPADRRSEFPYTRALIAPEAAVQLSALNQKVAHIRELRGRTDRAKFDDSCRRLVPGMPEAEISLIKVAQPVQDRLTRSRTDWAGLREQRASELRLIENEAARLAELRSEVGDEEETPGDQTLLDLDGLRDEKRDEISLIRSLGKSQGEIGDHISQEARRLRPQMPEGADLHHLPLPADLAVTAWGDEYNRITSAVNEASRDLAARTQERDSLEAILRERYVEAVPTHEELETARSERRNLWQALAAEWTVERALETEQAINRTDGLADRMIEAGEAIASRQRLASVSAEHNALARELANRTREREAWTMGWVGLWLAAGVEEAEGIAQMREFVQRVLVIRGHTDAAAELGAQIAALHESIDRFARDVRARIPDAPEGWDELLVTLRNRADAIRGAKTRREALLKQIRALETKIAGRKSTVERLTHEIDEASTAFNTEWTDLTLPAQGDPEAAMQRLRDILDLSQTARDMESIAAFEAEVLALEADLRRELRDAYPDLDVLAEERVGYWYERSSAERAAHIQSETIRETLLARARESLARSSDGAGGQPREQDLRDEARRLSDLVSDRGEEGLAADLRAVESEQAANDAAQRAAEDELRRLRQEYDAFGDGAGADSHRRAAALRAELVERSEEWARLTLALEVYRRVLASYNERHQPSILRRSGEMMREVTGGRFVRLRAAAGGELALERSDGRELLPGELSAGTRDQLYLSLRVAHAMEYCMESEPLPVILDDPFVNCDPERLERVLQALQPLSEQTQVLYFTCHPHAMEIATRVFGPRAGLVRLGAAQETVAA